MRTRVDLQLRHEIQANSFPHEGNTTPSPLTSQLWFPVLKFPVVFTSPVLHPTGTSMAHLTGQQVNKELTSPDPWVLLPNEDLTLGLGS